MTEGQERRQGADEVETLVPPPASRVREHDLEPHAGLRYIAGLFKFLAILNLVMLIAEVIIGLTQAGTDAMGTLLVEGTRLLVFAAFLWASGDIVLMLIESNHDLRATRIMLGRVHASLQRMSSDEGPEAHETTPRAAD